MSQVTERLAILIPPTQRQIKHDMQTNGCSAMRS